MALDVPAKMPDIDACDRILFDGSPDIIIQGTVLPGHQTAPTTINQQRATQRKVTLRITDER